MVEPAAPSSEPIPASVPAEAARAGSGRWAWLGTLASVVLFAASIVVLYNIVSEVSLADVRAAFARATLNQLALAFLFVVLSYSILTLYDMLALRQLQLKIRYRTTALASFASFAISFTLGFPLVTAAGVRYWIYARRGVSAGKVASLTLIAGLTFLLGMAAVTGFGLIWQAQAMSEINHLAVSLNRVIGVLTFAGLAGYVVWIGLKRRAVRVKRFRIELPSLPVSVAQIVLGVCDVCAAGAVLYMLLPTGHGVEFQTFAAVYAFACLLGIVSHAPGGLGVFEATILLAFYRLPYDGLIGALLLFRLMYYLIPFVFALILLGAYEIARRLKAYRAKVARDDEPD